MKNDKIILASSSPRRIEMMKQNGISPDIISPDIDEGIPDELNIEQSVMYLALKKALYVEDVVLNKNQCKSINEIGDHPIIIAADTIVYAGKIIGKPKTEDEAFEILFNLRNKKHWVATGVALLKAGLNKRKVFYELTEVYFKDYSDEEIKSYITTSEPYDKAGGYAIQGTWGKYIDHIKGDYNNVIGFPWTRIKEELKGYV